eukprot:3244939-Lingulodinium_polyedra.AAC.1
MDGTIVGRREGIDGASIERAWRFTGQQGSIYEAFVGHRGALMEPNWSIHGALKGHKCSFVGAWSVFGG